MKIKGYKNFDGCPKCGEYDHESWCNGFDYLEHNDKRYVVVHYVTTCNCGHRYKFDEIYKYKCDLIEVERD